VTSLPDALSGLTTVGIAEADDALGLASGATAVWNGGTGDASTVLVAYTVAGDADLSGIIDGDDFFPQLEEAIAQATNSIHADVYIFDRDDVGTGIADQLKSEIQNRLAKAGVEVLEARISHLAYAPEIAGAMLRRQQAGAVIAARQRIVEGAVGMVDMALELLKSKHVVELDEERKAAMVSNLLVVLCGEHDVRPVVNTGTIYQ